MASHKFSVRSGWDGKGLQSRKVGYSPRRVEATISHYDDNAFADIVVEAVLAEADDGKINGMVTILLASGRNVTIRILDGEVVSS